MIRFNPCFRLCVQPSAIFRRKYSIFGEEATRSVNKENELHASIKRKPSYKLLGKDRGFVDLLRIQVKGGNGGDGCVAFLREAGRPKGPPSGGNGGRGGNVILQASLDICNLRSLRTKYTASSGNHGQGKMMHGKKAEDLVIQVPVGTVITEYVSPIVHDRENSNSDAENILTRLKRKNPGESLESELRPGPPISTFPESIELKKPGQVEIVALGGMGGYGNIHFSSTHTSPRKCSMGQPGQSRLLQLELKSIADVGIVGLPNAGKSSLLNAISNTNSRVAEYPFTTLHPFIGSLSWPDYTQTTIADIPGLVKGAHLNYGLGHDFLRHIERTRILIYVIDLSDDPIRDLTILIEELEKYRPNLSKRPSLIVGNKADRAPQSMDGFHKLKSWIQSQNHRLMWNLSDSEDLPNWEVIPISAKYCANLSTFYSKLKCLIDLENVES